MAGCDMVFHLAANADVRFGPSIPAATSSRTPSRPSTCSKRCAPTASSASPSPRPARSTARPKTIPTPEDAPFPVQTSLYGASKLAGEGMIAAYCEGLRLPGYIFRFVSILGERYTHGHVFDFYKQLAAHPTTSTCSATARSANRISTSATAWTRCSTRSAADAREAKHACKSTTSAPTNIAR